MPRPATPAQMPIARARSLPENVFVRIDSVVGKMNAPPIPMRPRATISISGEVERDASAENVPNMTSPAVERLLAPEAIAERAGGEQQAGEHDRVRVDDPLQLRPLGTEVADDRRQRDVEDRVVDADDDEREAEDGERHPAPLMDLLRGHRHPGLAPRTQIAAEATVVDDVVERMAVESMTRW